MVTSAASSQAASPLFRLPAEIRYEIYRWLLLISPPIQPYACGPLRLATDVQRAQYTTNTVVRASDINAGLLFTCRRCRDEFLPLFTDAVTLCIRDSTVLWQIIADAANGVRQSLKIFHAAASAQTQAGGDHDGTLLPSDSGEEGSNKVAFAWIDIEYSRILNLLVLGHVLQYVLFNTQYLSFAFPALRQLTLRSVFLVSITQLDGNDTAKYCAMRLQPPGCRRQVLAPVPLVLSTDSSSSNSCAETLQWRTPAQRCSSERETLPMQQTAAKQFSLWLEQAVHGTDPDPRKAAELSAHNVLLIGDPQPFQSAVKRFIDPRSLPTHSEKGGPRSHRSNKLAETQGDLNPKIKPEIAIEGEARLVQDVRLDRSCSIGFSVKDENHLDTVIFDIDIEAVNCQKNSGLTLSAETNRTIGIDTHRYPGSWNRAATDTVRNIRVASLGEKRQRLVPLPLMSSAPSISEMSREIGSIKQRAMIVKGQNHL